MQPYIKIGILQSEQVEFELKGSFHIENSDNELIADIYLATLEENQINISDLILSNLPVKLVPHDDATFIIKDVVIGIGFHWERKEDQEFNGCLELLHADNQIIAINHAPVEDYLKSVISSEMSATSSAELLKAHAIISRSWVLAQIDKNKDLSQQTTIYQSHFQSDTEIVKWYDREDHHHFDVCADDHCQRYQGIGRVSNPEVEKAIDATLGQILEYQGKICDARFSKCCGGATELFENCWEPVHHPYLTLVHDTENVQVALPDLTIEENAREWITSSPSAFCNTQDSTVLKQVLNHYDQETTQFYRWQVVYNQQEMSTLVTSKTGVDFGDILDLEPLERGASGRIIKLKIVGSRRTMIIGKELEIRKALSTSHLYSSAFVVDKQMIDNTLQFTLTGAGWGHGVGLCQIGAAMMSHQGYTHQQILMHYFKNASLVKRY
jgi:SpoIID/LytB domain protein